MASSENVAQENQVKEEVNEIGGSMSCEDIRDLLYLYVCQELEPDERDEVEAHLTECDACRVARDEHKKLAGGLGGLFRGRNLYYYSINN